MSEKQLFDKAIIFADIHYGIRKNDPLHNEDCNEFIDWMISYAKDLGINKAIFLGDWHHNRHSINVETMKYSWQGLKKINDNFDITYMIVGNHDLYYKYNRNVSSIVFAESFPNIKIIDEKYTKDNATFYPWLVDDEWKNVKKSKSKYIFGHFELPEFYLNSMVKMPDNGKLKYDDFTNQRYVFTGHFHKRQWKGNVCYVGSCFPHNFNDVNDDERGFMVLEWDKEPIFYDWDNGPTFRSFEFKNLKNNEDYYIGDNNKLNLKIYYDNDDGNSTEVQNYRDWLIENYPVRTIKLLESSKQELFEGEEIDDAEVCDNVDSIVINQIKSMDTEEYDIDMLINMYNDL
ncbi:recombination endonuclease [Salicola phage SCTP-2]|nr:recombination endonuclease [Salicola phage SCTP-2]